jgi:GDP-4-dehydro-6-deoxy-D-mannose reductase
VAHTFLHCYTNMNMNIAITGVNGFVGKHLTNVLIENGHSVIGIGQEEQPHESIKSKLIEYSYCDLTEAWPNLQTQVDAIIHLAGLAAVGPSFDRPQVYLNLNSAMVTNMCEYYLAHQQKPRIVLVSSGSVYDPHQTMPISESGKIAFSSPYAVSKILTENQAVYYNERGLECVVMRPFNHIGPGQLPGFLVPDLAEKIRTRSSQNEPLRVGNLATKRDYTDVRDVAKAYVAVATSDHTPHKLVYNVCSGKSISGEEVLAALVRAFDITEPSVKIDPSFIRPTDIMDIQGDNSTLSQEFNWKPTYKFQQTIDDFVNSL